jgi:hypothetical protein
VERTQPGVETVGEKEKEGKGTKDKRRGKSGGWEARVS